MTDRENAPNGDVERVHNALLNIRAICDREVYEGRNNGTLDHIHGFAVAGLSALSAMPDRQAERAAIVAWLRAYKRDDTNWPQVLANAIENGEHLKG